jgi:deoxyribose-phosphate aldolase
MNASQLARMIDHTILKPEAIESDIRRVIAEAIAFRFATVCVNGRWVELAAKLLSQAEPSAKADQRVAVCAVVGFPLGANRSAAKAMEAADCGRAGAGEIDMVVSLGDLLAGRADLVQEDIAAVVNASRAARKGTLVKVILETAALTEAQTALGCEAAAKAGADFVKTSTGFHAKGGATVQAVQWLKRYGGGAGLKVKASGGIRDLATAMQMVAAGADRLGCSASVSIVTEAAAKA